MGRADRPAHESEEKSIARFHCWHSGCPDVAQPVTTVNSRRTGQLSDLCDLTSLLESHPASAAVAEFVNRSGACEKLHILRASECGCSHALHAMWHPGYRGSTAACRAAREPAVGAADSSAHDLAHGWACRHYLF